MTSYAEMKFRELWLAIAPDVDLHAEHRFHPTRRWRFDFAHLPSQTAIEIEGGIWSQGRHTRGAGYQGDLTKYLEASLLGWRVLRLSPEMITRENLERIRVLIEGRA